MPLSLANVLRRDRIIVLTGLAAVVVIAWMWLALNGASMQPMAMDAGQAMSVLPPWSPAYAALMLAMWTIMMVAMMLPSAAPTILLVDALARRESGQAAPLRAGVFVAGYLIVWFGFSIVATTLQWSFARLGVLSGNMELISRGIAGVLLVAAGLYQWTPLKRLCLTHCRSPIAFLVQHWQTTGFGPVMSGMRHGLFCVGCCWILMLLLFVGGLMNLLWVAALAFLVFVEKVLPWGGRVRIVTGGALVVWGGVVLAGPVSVL